MKIIYPSIQLIRYVDKSISGWDIVIPPSDIIQVKNLSSGQNIKVQLSKKLLRVDGLSVNDIYPNPLKLQRDTLINDVQSIHTLFQVQNGTRWGVQSPYKVIKLNYGGEMGDKFGYYNSLVPDFTFNPPKKYYLDNQLNHYQYFVDGQTIVSNDIISQGYTSKLQQIWLPRGEITNIMTICHLQDSITPLYGFMEQISQYEISFDVSLVKNGVSVNPSDNIMVRCLPYNGISDFEQLLSNPQIGITKKQFLTPTSTFFTKSNLQIYNQSQTQYVQSQDGRTYRLNNQLQRPSSRFSDFNFMFDKYGQFLTCRSLSQKYFKFNNKRYVDIFGDVSQQFTLQPNGKYNSTTYINKNFQGNSILSIMVNQDIDKLISNYEQVWVLQISNVVVKKLF